MIHNETLNGKPYFRRTWPLMGQENGLRLMMIYDEYYQCPRCDHVFISNKYYKEIDCPRCGLRGEHIMEDSVLFDEHTSEHIRRLSEEFYKEEKRQAIKWFRSYVDQNLYPGKFPAPLQKVSTS